MRGSEGEKGQKLMNSNRNRKEGMVRQDRKRSRGKDGEEVTKGREDSPILTFF